MIKYVLAGFGKGETAKGMKMKKTNEEKMEKKQENDDYSFMQEQIKKRPINKKRLIKRTFTTGALAIMFGVIASLVFILLEPALTKLVTPKEEKVKITLPETTLPEEVNEVLPENMIQEQEELDEKGKAAEKVTPIASAIQKAEFEIEDYQKVYEKLSDVADGISTSMVVVTGSSSEMDWFSNVYEKKSSVSGVVVADNGMEYYLITNYSYLSSATSFDVIFSNQEVCKGKLAAYDKATNIMVLSVPFSELKNPEEITCASLGNSNVGIYKGDVVIAVGDPMGYSESVGYGIITSLGSPVNTPDHNYKLITTDIYGSRNAEGYLLNTRGQVIGVLNQKYNNSDLSNQISAIGISELKHLIEDLSNQVQRPYLGMTLAEITPQAVVNGIPQGAFVRKVEIDSPAMEVGIVPGDIIVRMGSNTISSAAEAEEQLRGCKVGDEISLSILRLSGQEYKPADVTVTVGEKKE